MMCLCATEAAPLSGRKVTRGRRRNTGKGPDTAIPPSPDQPSNTNFHYFLPALPKYLPTSSLDCEAHTILAFREISALGTGLIVAK